MLKIQNEFLTLTVDPHGAQMLSLRSESQTEYLWQGDAVYWGDRAPILFPFVARLTDDSYLLNGKRYPMGIHGFAAASDFVPTDLRDDAVTLVLTDSDETLRQYPFSFRFAVRYALRGRTAEITFAVDNLSEETMPFGLGGHPGFRVPFAEGTKFEDYELKFSRPCTPDRVGFTPQVYLSGVNTRYPLVNGDTLPLDHSLFDEDAIILQNMDRTVTLRCRSSGAAVTVSAPQMPYFGFWHAPKTDAPYLCIEPWLSLPSRQGVVEELTCKSDLAHLPPHGHYENTWSITVTE